METTVPSRECDLASQRVHATVRLIDRVVGESSVALDTGNPYIDALGGAKWTGAQYYDPDGALHLDYFFDNDTSADHSTGGAWTLSEQQAFAAALKTWEDVTYVRFVPVSSAAAADFIVLKVTAAELPDASGRANTPDEPDHYVEFNTDYHWDAGSLAPGGEMFQTFIHEVGHVLGLAHPHDNDMGTDPFPGIELVDADGNPLPAKDIEKDKGDHDLNSSPFTAMGYNDNFDAFQNLARDRGFAATPLAFDIAAIQRMYGMVNKDTGDTVYTLVDAGAGSSFTTIWDTGGHNTIRYDGSAFSVIDMRFATLQNEFGGGGFLSRVDGTIGGFTLAGPGDNNQPEVTIDDAIGGSGTDKIFGNYSANVIDGRGGADTIEGGRGNDTMTGGADSDTFVFEDGWGQDTITDFKVGEDGDALDLLAVDGDGLVRARDTADGLKIFISINPDDVPVDFIILTGVTAEDFRALGPAVNIRATQRFGDGYISGGTVFADANGNGRFDVREASDTTDANGVFSLQGQAGTLIGFGGVDTSTGLPFTAQLSAPAHSLVISPLTTLLVAGASESSLLAAFNLQAGLGLTVNDPIVALLAGDADGAKLFAAGAKVIDTVIAIATAVAGLGGDEADAQQQAFAALAAAINALSVGATLNLSNAATISALLNSVAQLQGIDASALATAVGNAVAQSNAAIDQHLATDGASQALLTNVSTVQAELQSNEAPVAVDDSAIVLKGKTLVGNVLANDSDPDGDPLTVVSIEGGNINTAFAGKFGTLTVEADGDYQYVANKKGFPAKIVLQDSFDYGILDDAAGVASASLTVLVLPSGYKYQAGENTTLTGTNGKDVLDGSAGGVTALGGKSADILIGGPEDILTGGKGPDIFVFRPDFGENVITDFEFKRTPRGDSTPASDKIQIDSSVFATFADLFAHASDTAAGVLIDDGEGNTITINGIKLAQLHASDFYLV
jgi:Ca2+-binding RTX toxin-like protein